MTREHATVFFCRKLALHQSGPQNFILQGAQGSVAVRTEGSGALQGVRIINLCRDTLFWFRVDSAEPAQMPRLPVAAPVKQEQLIIGHMGVITPDKTEVYALEPSKVPTTCLRNVDLVPLAFTCSTVA